MGILIPRKLEYQFAEKHIRPGVILDIGISGSLFYERLTSKKEIESLKIIDLLSPPKKHERILKNKKILFEQEDIFLHVNKEKMRFDTILLLSTLEHLYLPSCKAEFNKEETIVHGGAYIFKSRLKGLNKTKKDKITTIKENKRNKSYVLSKQITLLKRISSLLNSKESRIILTVPYGTPTNPPEFQLFYDKKALTRIEENFIVLNKKFITKKSEGWEKCTEEGCEIFSSRGGKEKTKKGIIMMSLLKK
jgi:2-polyprenyl-3-methyl-5-hydroxy-6-metoxy-1,4-benzoquinol methylase